MFLNLEQSRDQMIQKAKERKKQNRRPARKNTGRWRERILAFFLAVVMAAAYMPLEGLSLAAHAEGESGTEANPEGAFVNFYDETNTSKISQINGSAANFIANIWLTGNKAEAGSLWLVEESFTDYTHLDSTNGKTYYVEPTAGDTANGYYRAQFKNFDATQLNAGNYYLLAYMNVYEAVEFDEDWKPTAWSETPTEKVWKSYDTIAINTEDSGSGTAVSSLGTVTLTPTSDEINVLVGQSVEYFFKVYMENTDFAAKFNDLTTVLTNAPAGLEVAKLSEDKVDDVVLSQIGSYDKNHELAFYMYFTPTSTAQSGDFTFAVVDNVENSPTYGKELASALFTLNVTSAESPHGEVTITPASGTFDAYLGQEFVTYLKARIENRYSRQDYMTSLTGDWDVASDVTKGVQASILFDNEMDESITSLFEDYDPDHDYIIKLSCTPDLESKLGAHTFTFSLNDFMTGSPTLKMALASGEYTINVEEKGGPVIEAPSLGTVKIGKSYEYQVSAQAVDGGALTYSAQGLPDGLIINAETGKITGIPTKAGTFTVKITVSEAGGSSSETSGTFMVEGLDAPVIATTALPSGFTQKAYGTDEAGSGIQGFQIAASPANGGTLTYTAEGLPAGMTLSQSGFLSGTPGEDDFDLSEAEKTYPVTVTVTESVTVGASEVSGTGVTLTQEAKTSLDLKITKTLRFTTEKLDPLVLDTYFGQYIRTNYSSYSLDWSIVYGEGSIINETDGYTGFYSGYISGIPKSLGDYSFTVTAKAADGQTVSNTFEGSVKQKFKLVIPSAITAKIGEPVYVWLTADFAETSGDPGEGRTVTQKQFWGGTINSSSYPAGEDIVIDVSPSYGTEIGKIRLFTNDGSKNEVLCASALNGGPASAEQGGTTVIEYDGSISLVEETSIVSFVKLPAKVVFVDKEGTVLGNTSEGSLCYTPADSAGIEGVSNYYGGSRVEKGSVWTLQAKAGSSVRAANPFFDYTDQYIGSAANGMKLTADGSDTVTITVPAITASYTVSGTAKEAVVGTAVAGKEIKFYQWVNGTRYEQTVTTGSDGSYAVKLYQGFSATAEAKSFNTISLMAQDLSSETGKTAKDLIFPAADGAITADITYQWDKDNLDETTVRYVEAIDANTDAKIWATQWYLTDDENRSYGLCYRYPSIGKTQDYKLWNSSRAEALDAWAKTDSPKLLLTWSDGWSTTFPSIGGSGEITFTKQDDGTMYAKAEINLKPKAGVVLNITNNAEIFAQYKVMWFKYDEASGAYLYSYESDRISVNPGESKDAPFVATRWGEGQYKAALLSGWSEASFSTWEELAAADTDTDDIVQLWDGASVNMTDGVALSADPLTFENAVVTNQRYITKPGSNVSAPSSYEDGDLITVTGHIALDEGYTGKMTSLTVAAPLNEAFAVRGISIDGQYYPVESEGEKGGAVARISDIYFAIVSSWGNIFRLVVPYGKEFNLPLDFTLYGIPAAGMDACTFDITADVRVSGNGLTDRGMGSQFVGSVSMSTTQTAMIAPERTSQRAVTLTLEAPKQGAQVKIYDGDALIYTNDYLFRNGRGAQLVTVTLADDDLVNKNGSTVQLSGTELHELRAEFTSEGNVYNATAQVLYVKNGRNVPTLVDQHLSSGNYDSAGVWWGYAIRDGSNYFTHSVGEYAANNPQSHGYRFRADFLDAENLDPSYGSYLGVGDTPVVFLYETINGDCKYLPGYPEGTYKDSEGRTVQIYKSERFPMLSAIVSMQTLYGEKGAFTYNSDGTVSVNASGDLSVDPALTSDSRLLLNSMKDDVHIVEVVDGTGVIETNEDKYLERAKEVTAEESAQVLEAISDSMKETGESYEFDAWYFAPQEGAGYQTAEELFATVDPTKLTTQEVGFSSVRRDITAEQAKKEIGSENQDYEGTVVILTSGDEDPVKYPIIIEIYETIYETDTVTGINTITHRVNNDGTERYTQGIDCIYPGLTPPQGTPTTIKYDPPGGTHIGHRTGGTDDGTGTGGSGTGTGTGTDGTGTGSGTGTGGTDGGSGGGSTTEPGNNGGTDGGTGQPGDNGGTDGGTGQPGDNGGTDGGTGQPGDNGSTDGGNSGTDGGNNSGSSSSSSGSNDHGGLKTQPSASEQLTLEFKLKNGQLPYADEQAMLKSLMVNHFGGRGGVSFFWKEGDRTMALVGAVADYSNLANEDRGMMAGQYDLERLMNSPCVRKLSLQQRLALENEVTYSDHTKNSAMFWNGTSKGINLAHSIIDFVGLYDALDTAGQKPLTNADIALLDGERKGPKLTKGISWGTILSDTMIMANWGSKKISDQYKDNLIMDQENTEDLISLTIWKYARQNNDEDCLKTVKPIHFSGLHDPSGVVYEAVLSNTIEGATVKLYTEGTDSGSDYIPVYGDDGTISGLKNKKTGEVITGSALSGDKLSLYDATLIQSENPLVTGKDGVYQWFVPQGLWYVTAEKEGYVTGTSDDDIQALVQGQTTGNYYLPVLPPQLAVNIPLVNYDKPEITAGNIQAKTEGIFITFSKYMDEEALADAGTGAGIRPFSVTDLDGNEIPYTIIKLNSEQAPGNRDYNGKDAAGQGDIPSYTSSIELKFDTALAAETKLNVSVQSGQLKSYAGIFMDEAVFAGLEVSEFETLGAPEVSLNSGKYDRNTVLMLSLPDSAPAGSYLVYTTDGSDPVDSVANRQKSPVVINIDRAMTVKAIAVKDGYLASNVTTASYTVNAVTAAFASVNEGPVQPTYQITEGDGSKWIIGEDGSITITGNGDFAKFTGVKVDGILIYESNYEAKSGSTVITLKKAFLDTLGTGSHEIEILWTDGSAKASFTVAAAGGQTGGESGGNTENSGDSGDTGNSENVEKTQESLTAPLTDDMLAMPLWGYLLLAILILAADAGWFLYARRRWK